MTSFDGMQKNAADDDTMHNQDSPQEQPSQSFQCSHCPLKFKSEVFLQEHLSHVHGSDLDLINHAEKDSPQSIPGSPLCGLQTDPSDLNHLENGKNLKEDVTQKPATEIMAMSANHHEVNNEKEEDKEAHLISTSRVIHDTSRDLKTYTKPLQTPTIRNSFTVNSSQQESESNNQSDDESNIVPATIDIFNKYDFLQQDNLYADIMRPNEVATLESKRTSNTEKTMLEETDKKELSFEVSEDDEDKHIKPPTYSCKHCYHKDDNLKHMSDHYHKTHPYVRFEPDYIQDENDQSATFRCLVCPIEFLKADDLRKHYINEHPGSPDIFSLGLDQINLVYKCFTCAFTTNALDMLQDHYKARHSPPKALNALLFLKYMLAPCRKVPSPVISSALENPEPSVALYQCNKCPFHHKSVIVLQVHYQKNHPEEVVTIDMIKRQAGVPPIKRPECLSSKVEVKTKDKVKILESKLESSVPESVSESSAAQTKIKYNVEAMPELSIFERFNESSEAQMKTKDKIKILEPELESSVPKKVRESSDAQTKTKHKVEATPQLCTSEKVKETTEAGTKSKDKVNIPKAKLESILLGKAGGNSEGKTKTKDKVKILKVMSESSSAEKVRKKKSQLKVNICDAKSESFIPEKVDEDQNKRVESEQTHKDEGLIPNRVTEPTSLDIVKNVAKPEGLTPTCQSAAIHLYDRPENLFYCFKCNYGNPTIKGLTVHQYRTHDHLRTSTEDIVEYTTKIHSSLRKSVAQGESQSLYLLPLPILNKGDEHTFFCHFCHYRRSTVSKVVQHYNLRHNGLVATPKQIQSYTFRTLELLQKKNGSEEDQHEKTSNNKAAPLKFKSLQCKGCVYKTHNPSLFRIHVRKCQRGNHSSSGVLKVYLKQGNAQSGYQCDLCAFTHKRSTMLYKHYRQEHPDSRSSREFIATRLKKSHKSSHLKKKSQIRQDVGNRVEVESNANEQSDTRTYFCRACSFKGSSLEGLNDHYRAVHPWCLKEDGLVSGKGSRKKSSSSKKKDHRWKQSSCFDDSQVPFKCPDDTPEHPKSATPPIQEDKNSVSKKSKHTVGMGEKTHVHVFKCPYCTYVNTKHQGVLTHCQMRHPDLQSRADSLYVDKVNFCNLNKKHKGQEGEPSHFRGYMCELCPQTHETEKKLKRHREQDHGETLPDSTTVQEAIKKPVKIPKSASLKIKVTLYRCQQCAYSCINKMAFGRHMRLKHKSSAFQVCRYNCVLCSNSYFKKKRLGNHYKSKHGEDAYLEHFLPICESTPETAPEPQAKTGTTSRRLVYKCPSCPYVNSRPHGMATHCQMMHPKLTVRVNEFERSEIVISSGYQAGSINKRGYLCDVCQGICMTLKKLAIHCSKKHTEVPKQETEKATPKDGNSQKSVSVGDSLTNENPNEKSPKKIVNGDISYKCLLCSFSSKIRKRLAVHYNKMHGKHAFRKHFAPLYLRKPKKAPNSSPEAVISEPLEKPSEPQETPPEGEELLFKCELCEYSSWARRYLTYHYNKTHQLDMRTRNMLLMSYNKRKRPPPRDLPQDLAQKLQTTEKTDLTKCKKCPSLSFDSPELLLAHYCAAHRASRRIDFTVIHPAGRNTGVYQCTRCHKKLNGTWTLGRHLDGHREKNLAHGKAKKKMATPLGKKTVKLNPLDPTAEGLSVCNEPKEEGSSLTSSIVASPKEAIEPEQIDTDSLSESYPCSQCQRTFKSLNGVRTHERSHKALAAIKKLPASLSQINLNKYLLHKPGTIRPFQCSICLYRTNLMGLWNNHLLKNHLDIVIQTCDDKQETSVTQSVDRDTPNLGSRVISSVKTKEGCTKDWYLEPPEVRRQLSHFSLMAQNGATTITRHIDSGGLFHCENCVFLCEDLPSMRRHYLSKHGRKMFTCKDCNFFTGLKRAMKIHMDTDHSTFQKEAPPQDGLHCPFCLYQTNNKNNMIDHVMLHREERVVPMEVRRPKLSRYLQGLVFRCHVCTYTSASTDNLRLHTAKHECVKPYRCRLCYFDCARLDELEAHLCEKHQVMRNHELVGQVNLEQLEQVKFNKGPENEEDEQMSNPKNAEDLYSPVKETDGRKPTEEAASDTENHLPETAAVKQEHQVDADPPKAKDSNNSQLFSENREEKEGTTSTTDEEEGCTKENNENTHSLKLQTLNIKPHVENDFLQHDLDLDRESGTQSPLHVEESPSKVAKKTLKGVISAPLLGHTLETSAEDRAHKRKLCERLKEEGTTEEEGQDCEGQTKRIKVEDTCKPQNGDTPELTGIDNTLTCNLCGRNLQSEEALHHHVSRHGM